jgi:hypothetical protein
MQIMSRRGHKAEVIIATVSTLEARGPEARNELMRGVATIASDILLNCH